MNLYVDQNPFQSNALKSNGANCLAKSEKKAERNEKKKRKRYTSCLYMYNIFLNQNLIQIYITDLKWFVHQSVNSSIIFRYIYNSADCIQIIQINSRAKEESHIYIMCVRTYMIHYNVEWKKQQHTLQFNSGTNVYLYTSIIKYICPEKTHKFQTNYVTKRKERVGRKSKRKMKYSEQQQKQDEIQINNKTKVK